MKRGLVILAGLSALLALLSATGVWLATTADGLRWLTHAAGAMSRGHLQFEGVQGDLSGRLGIAKLTVVSAKQRIEIENLRLEWRPRALWQRRVEVGLLAAQGLRLTVLQKDTTPPILPSSLRLPFDIDVHVADLARLEIVEAGRRFAFTDLRASLDGTGERYQLKQVAIATPWGDLHGDIAIDKNAPFVLQGHFDAASRQPMRARGVVALSGSLAAPEFSLEAKAEGMTFLARGVAAPFAKVRLTQLLLAGQGINPRQFLADAPEADLAFSGIFEGHLEADAAASASGNERLLGTFSLSNGLAGRLDQQRLPLANLTGAVLGDATHADFSSLLIDLGSAGQFIGDGQWHAGALSLKLASQTLNLAGFRRDLNPTRINTVLQLTGNALRQQISGEASESWGHGRFSVIHDASVLRLEALDFSGRNDEKLTAKGEMQLDAGRRFSVEFDAARINPANFGKFPTARLNARGRIGGALLPELSLKTTFTLPPGELEGRQIKGRGELQYQQRHLVGADLDLDLAGNLLRLQGAYGRAGDSLSWDIRAPELARLKLGLSGSLNSSGSFSGAPGQARIDARLDAGSLRLPGDIAADSVNLKLDLRASGRGALSGTLDARGLTLAGRHLSQLRANAEGYRDAHTLNLDARLPDWRISASLSGGLDANQVWRGQLTQAEAQGDWPMRLTAPASLLMSETRQEVGNLALTLAGGHVRVEHLSRQGDQIASRGALDSLPLAPLLALLDKPPRFSTDLSVDGEWNLRLGASLDGQASLRRRSGDVRLNDPALRLGLGALRLDIEAVANRLSAKATAVSSEVGQLRAEGELALLREGAGFTVSRSAPLLWKAQLDGADLRLAKPYMPLGMRADARIDARLQGAGSLAAPRLEGRIDAAQVQFSMPEQGILISDGTLKLGLKDDALQVREGVLKGSSGQVVISGEAKLKDAQAGLTLNFEKFAASNRSDRRIIVSGATRLDFDRKRLQLSGDLTADRARLEMPAASRPILSDDVVIVGQAPREKSASQRLPLALDLKLNLGKDLLFKGAGLDVRLGGQLRAYTANDVLRGDGVIQVEAGRFAAYAQTLDIERGVLRFNGPIDNPGLDVLAVRKSTTVKAGVQVRGTVRRPVVTLYSDPILPDTEKLAWLVLGHGLENGGQQEFALLQIAAGAVLSKAESVNLQSQLADALHIDSFGVRAGDGTDLTSAVVSVGKRLSSRTMLSYEQSLDGLSQVVKVLYQLSPRVRLEAQAGEQSSIDAFYSMEYD